MHFLLDYTVTVYFIIVAYVRNRQYESLQKNIRKEMNVMPKLSERVGTFTDSVIRRMTRISDEYGGIDRAVLIADYCDSADHGICKSYHPLA